ncbi:MAG: hypothetical protein LC672_03325, partial [Acidobacteria bacterium]|nr:hypothetical protein [Acidobacteriota bacterium]
MAASRAAGRLTRGLTGRAISGILFIKVLCAPVIPGVRFLSLIERILLVAPADAKFVFLNWQITLR